MTKPTQTRKYEAVTNSVVMVMTFLLAYGFKAKSYQTLPKNIHPHVIAYFYHSPISYITLSYKFPSLLDFIGSNIPVYQTVEYY
jgi:ABC-type transport system involved in cytochrome c biogenesis permease subunit